METLTYPYNIADEVMLSLNQGLKVKVLIKNLNVTHNGLRYLITPIAGQGEQWVPSSLLNPLPSPLAP